MALSDGSAEIIRPDFAFLRTVERRSGQPVRSCFRCLKCTAGCPLAVEMDYPPDRMIRMVQLGLKEKLLRSRGIWLCTSCVACSDRCPNGIDVAAVVDCLRQMSLAGGYAAGEPQVAAFHLSFLDVVRRFGRLHEASLIGLLKLRTRDWLGDLGAGLGLLVRGKIPLLPRRVRGGEQVEKLFRSVPRRNPEPSDKGGTG
jgi:heterodisulfide reductase subunit C